MRLIHHHNEHNIPPDQYKYVEKSTNIRSFRPINRQRSRVVLQQFWNNGFQGQPVRYRNIRELDLSDDRNLDVDSNTWRSLNINLVNLFESNKPLLGPHGATFAAFLIGQFFSNVTSINFFQLSSGCKVNLAEQFVHIRYFLVRSGQIYQFDRTVTGQFNHLPPILG